MCTRNSDVTIRLTNESETYEPGQAITGKVVIKTHVEEEIKGVTINLEGKATVHQFSNEDESDSDEDHENWQKRQAKFSETSVTYVKMRNYYKLGSDSIGQIFQIGETSYAFNFKLPDRNLPCSFTGKYGKVQYVINVTVQRSFWKVDYEVKKVITIRTVVDLNMDPEASLPGDWTLCKTFGFLCCASKPMSLNVRIGRTGYCVGEVISVGVKVVNLSNRRVNNVVVEFVQEVRYVGVGNERKIVKVLCTRKWGESVEAGESGEWGVGVEVPGVEPSGLGGCKVIGVSYYLKVQAHVFGIVFNLKQECPIIIGTVPLRDDNLQRSETNSTLVFESQCSDWSKSGMYPDLANGNDALPPTVRVKTCSETNGNGVLMKL